jgi:hypothetical protein
MKPVKVMLIIVGMLIFSTSLCFAAPSPSGDFIIVDFDDDTDFNTPWAGLSLVNLDGNGNGTYQELFSADPPLESGSFTYAVAANGMLTLYAEAEPGYGIVSADGSIFTIAWTNVGEPPGITIGIKKSSGMSNGSANGYYLMSGFGDETDSNSPWSDLVRIYLDGNGNGTYQDLYTSDNDPESGSFTYSIAADGMLTIYVMGFQFHGMVSADGSIFTLAEINPSESGIDVGIKESAGMSNASAKGCYLISQFEDGRFQNAPWAALTRICLDGSGNGTYQDLYTSDNDPLESGSFTYSIAADGQLTIYTEGMQFHGVASADGSVFTVAITVGLEPGILFGIKESSTGISAGIPLLLLDDQ